MKKFNLISIFILFFINNIFCQNIKNDLDSLFYAKKNSVTVLKPKIGVSIGIIKDKDIIYYEFGNKNRESSDKINKKDRKSTRLNSSHSGESRMPSSA